MPMINQMYYPDMVDMYSQGVNTAIKDQSALETPAVNALNRELTQSQIDNQSLLKETQQNTNQEKAMNRLSDMSNGFLQLTPEQRTQAYPMFKSQLLSVAPGLAQHAPEQWSESELPKLQSLANMNATRTSPLQEAQIGHLNAQSDHLNDNAMNPLQQSQISLNEARTKNAINNPGGSNALNRVDVMDPETGRFTKMSRAEAIEKGQLKNAYVNPKGDLTEGQVLSNIKNSYKDTAKQQEFYQLFNDYRNNVSEGKQTTNSRAYEAASKHMIDKEKDRRLVMMNEKYATKDEIKKAMSSGQLKKEEAVQLLIKYHGFPK